MMDKKINLIGKSVTLTWYITAINVVCYCTSVISRKFELEFLMWITLTLLVFNFILYLYSLPDRLKIKDKKIRQLSSIIFQPIFILFFIEFNLFYLGYNIFG